MQVTRAIVVIYRGYTFFRINMLFISLFEVQNVYFTIDKATNEVCICSLYGVNLWPRVCNILKTFKQNGPKGQVYQIIL